MDIYEYLYYGYLQIFTNIYIYIYEDLDLVAHFAPPVNVYLSLILFADSRQERCKSINTKLSPKHFPHH